MGKSLNEKHVGSGRRIGQTRCASGAWGGERDVKWAGEPSRISGWLVSFVLLVLVSTHSLDGLRKDKGAKSS